MVATGSWMRKPRDKNRGDLKLDFSTFLTFCVSLRMNSSRLLNML